MSEPWLCWPPGSLSVFLRLLVNSCSPSLRLPEALEDGSQTEVFLELPCHPWVGHLEVTLWFTGPCFSSSPESLILSLMTLFFKAHHSFHLREWAFFSPLKQFFFKWNYIVFYFLFIFFTQWKAGPPSLKLLMSNSSSKIVHGISFTFLKAIENGKRVRKTTFENYFFLLCVKVEGKSTSLV